MKAVLDDFRTFRRSETVGGIERFFVASILLLRGLSISYWMRAYLPSASSERRRIRDNIIDIYCVVQVVTVSAVLVFYPRGIIPIVIGAYILFEMFLVNLNIIFAGKFPTIQAPPASIERTVILLFINLIEVMVIFAIFYANAGLSRIDAIFKSTLVLGTAGYPEFQGITRLIVALQIFLDLALVLLLLGTLAAHMAFFRRPDLHNHSKPEAEPAVKGQKKEGGERRGESGVRSQPLTSPVDLSESDVGK